MQLLRYQHAVLDPAVDVGRVANRQPGALWWST